jgi:hypothetical protein
MAIQNSINSGFTTQVSGSISRAGTGNGLLPAMMIATVSASAGFTLAASAATQSCFPTTADVWTLEGSTTYLMEGQYILSTGTTTHTTALAFVTGSGITFTSFEYFVNMWNAAANTIATAQSTTHVTGFAPKVINATSNAVFTLVQFNGIVRTNNSGTLTPSIAFSQNPTGTNLMRSGSYIMFTPIGNSTFESIGSIA